MALTPYTGGIPQRNNRSTFSGLMDAFVTWLLETFMVEIDAVVDAMNLNDLNATSTTSITIGTGTQTFTTQSSKSYVNGMQLVIADDADPSNKWMQGRVTSYSGTTLEVDVQTKAGTGTLSDWIISFSAPVPYVGQQEVTVHTGNGVGSTNTKIRRFTTELTNVGTAITYADSSTLGASFTINTPGLYEIFTMDSGTAAGWRPGASLNSSQLTTNIQTITIADVILATTTDSANESVAASRTMSLTTNDVVRPHIGTSGSPGTSGQIIFSVRKVG